MKKLSAFYATTTALLEMDEEDFVGLEKTVPAHS
jgi:hypothetical protein